MKKNIPTQFLQINLASSDEIKNWAERLNPASLSVVSTKSVLTPPTILAKMQASSALPRFAEPTYSIAERSGAEPAISFAKPQSPGSSHGSHHPQSGKYERATLHSQSMAEPKGTTATDPAKRGRADVIDYVGEVDYVKVDREKAGSTPSVISTVGEIRKADTLNYRTLKPEKDGLFCERIFGPTIDWVCSCGHTKERGRGLVLTNPTRSSSLAGSAMPRYANEPTPPTKPTYSASKLVSVAGLDKVTLADSAMFGSVDVPLGLGKAEPTYGLAERGWAEPAISFEEHVGFASEAGAGVDKNEQGLVPGGVLQSRRSSESLKYPNFLDSRVGSRTSEYQSSFIGSLGSAMVEPQASLHSRSMAEPKGPKSPKSPEWHNGTAALAQQRIAPIRSADSSTDHEQALRGEIPIKICPLCGVEATTSRFRRYRMGYIGLACPVTHIWYLNSRPNLFALLLKMPTKYIKKVTYYKAYSPSLALPEYLSALLSPGGDFFDNEWEFLHGWLAGKYSSQDRIAPWNNQISFLAKPTQSHLSRDIQRSERTSETAKILVLPTSATSATSAPSAKPRVASFANEAKPACSANDMAGSALPGFAMPGFAMPYVGSALLTSTLSSYTNSECFKHLPDTPNWLYNTGAQALLNQLETKDWSHEIKKLEKVIHNSLISPASYGMAGSVGRFPHAERRSAISFAEHVGFARPGEAGHGAGAEVGEVGHGAGAGVDKNVVDYVKLGTATPGVAQSILKKRKNNIRQLKLLMSFQKSGFPTTQMIFSNIPVLPPELRPIIQLGAGQLASSDVNDLYRRVISRNNRLKYYLYETHFVEFLVRSEQQLVQLAVDALLENGKTTQVRHTSGQKRLYKSLSDRIGGKQGRFRMNLLGKRVDYSGRSVIVVGPQLHISNCGLPYEMAFELFQPFLLRHCIESLQCKTIRSAKNLLRLNKAFGRHILHAIISSHPILLNRAPTLHRLGIQAFQPLLVFGRAIHLHPLVCPAFNADFDGDQMAVHIPLSPSARVEARLLMLSSGNWLSASTGQPNLLPSQDMVLGFYYVTLEKYGFQKGKGFIYQNINDALQAYECGEIDLHSQIWLNSSGLVSASHGEALPLALVPAPHVGFARPGMAEPRSVGRAGADVARSSSLHEQSEQRLMPGKRSTLHSRSMGASHAVAKPPTEPEPKLTKPTYGSAEDKNVAKAYDSTKPNMTNHLWMKKKICQSISGDSVNRKNKPIQHTKDDANILIDKLKTYQIWRNEFRSCCNYESTTLHGVAGSQPPVPVRWPTSAPPTKRGSAMPCETTLASPSTESTSSSSPSSSRPATLDGAGTKPTYGSAEHRNEADMPCRPFAERTYDFAETRAPIQEFDENGNGKKIASHVQYKKGNSSEEILLSRRLFKTSEEPLHIRLAQHGFQTKIYTSYQWQENNENFLRNAWVRTTPGRLFFNQILQKYL